MKPENPENSENCELYPPMLNTDRDRCLLDYSIVNLIIISEPFYSLTNMHSSTNSGNVLLITAYINQVILSNNTTSKMDEKHHKKTPKIDSFGSHP